MRLGEKFSALLGGSVLATAFVITAVLMRSFVSHEEASLRDFQMSRSVAMARELSQKLGLFHSDIEVLLRSGRLSRAGDIVNFIRGAVSAELVIEPKGTSEWTVVPSPTTGSLRWIGRYPQSTIALDLPTGDFDEVLSATHGGITQLVSGDGVLLFSSDTSFVGTRFHAPAILGEIMEESAGLPKTSRYQSERGESFLGSFLKIQTDPPIAVAIVTPWSVIQSSVKRSVAKAVSTAVISTVVAILIAIGFSRTLVKPLQVLTRQVPELVKEKADLEDLTPLSRKKDEIGKLSRAFLQMSKDLHQSQRELQRAEQMAAVGKFSAMLVHEIKNPLTAILTSAEIVGQELRKPGSFERENVIRTNDSVRENTNRVNETVGRLLKFSRPSHLPNATMELTEQVKRSVGGLKALLDSKGIELVLSLPAKKIKIRGDTRQMEEVILNLILNACDAMKDSPQKKLSITLTAPMDQADLTITDTGTGMPPEVHAHLFEPFFTTKPFGEGTGLGLATCYNVVRAHCGTIRVESEPGKGATFRIQLPLVEEGDGLVAA